MTAGPTLVTGGTGVVGRAVVRHLVAAGRAVTVLSRSHEGDRLIESLGARPARGDILDHASLRSALRGVEVAYHLAGHNSFCVADPEPMMRVNVDGSRTVVSASKEAGVRRLVYTSSAATLGERTGTVGDENAPHRGHYLSDYERSKHLAEMAVTADAGSLEVVTVNPSSVQGPGRATGTGKIILDLINGTLPALVDTRLSIVDIDDCAAGHIKAEESGRAGERYILNGFTLNMRDAVALLEGVLERNLPVRFVPGWLALAAGAATEAHARIRGRPVRVCREMIRTMLHGHAYDGSKATRELGLEYTPADVTLRRLVDWFASEGLIGPGRAD